MPSEDFVEKLALPTPTPGGGAAAAHVGRVACALLRMVVGITQEKLTRAPSGPAETSAPGPEAVVPEGPKSLEALGQAAGSLSERFARLQEDDARAFGAYIEAGRLPRSSPEEKTARSAAREKALVAASEVPLQMLEGTSELLSLVVRAADLSRTTPLRAESDLFASGELARATFRVAELNLRANLTHLPEPAQSALRARWKAAREAFAQLCRRLPEAGGGPETP